MLASRDATLRGTADMQVALSRVAWERGDLAAAAECLRRADELGESGGLPQNPYRWRVAMAMLRLSEGDSGTALDLLDEAERVYLGDFSPDVRPVAATRARVLAASGQVGRALEWVRASGLSADDDVTYLREYELVTLVRVLLADYAASENPIRLTEATTLLDRLLMAAEAGGRTGALIEELALQALVRAAALHEKPALSALAHGLRLAEPQGCVSVFTREGAPMRGLLETIARRDRTPSYAGRLLSVMPSPERTRVASASSSGSSQGSLQLVDPVSIRKLDVLRYLASDLDGPAIARQLGVSLSTVRTHTQHIYAKLGVTNRRAAVRRAHQLNLFAHSRR